MSTSRIDFCSEKKKKKSMKVHKPFKPTALRADKHGKSYLEKKFLSRAATHHAIHFFEVSWKSIKNCINDKNCTCSFVHKWTHR